MGTALKNSGREIFYSINNWGGEEVTTWGKSIANSWRTTPDITIPGYTGTNYWQIMKGIFLANIQNSANAGPGAWNDPDHLLIGNSLLTADEEETHFSLWAFSKAPLVLATDLSKISDASLAVVNNTEIIGVNQDEYGYQATCSKGCDYKTVSVIDANILQDDLYRAVLIVNWSDSTTAATFDFIPADYYESTSADTCTVYELSGEKKTHSNMAPTNKLTYTLNPHASQSLKFKCLPF